MEKLDAAKVKRNNTVTSKLDLDFRDFFKVSTSVLRARAIATRALAALLIILRYSVIDSAGIKEQLVMK